MRIAGAMALVVVAATLVAGWRILRRAERRQVEIERLTESGLTMTEEPPPRPRETETPAPPDPTALAEQEARRVAAEREGRARAISAGVVRDPRTELCWTARDNGYDIAWDEALAYCEELRLGGEGGWTVPTLQELRTIYDRQAEDDCGDRHLRATCHPGLGIDLTAPRVWLAEIRVVESRRRAGSLAGGADEFYFPSGHTIDSSATELRTRSRALCVRRACQSRTVRDPATGLVWARDDNGENVFWGKAVKYCEELVFEGFDDWSIPTIEELATLYDETIEPYSRTSGMSGFRCRLRFYFNLTGEVLWSATADPDSFGRKGWRARCPSRFKGLNVRDGPGSEENSFGQGRRALCVRRPHGSPLSLEGLTADFTCL